MNKLFITFLMALFLGCAVGYNPQSDCNLCEAQLDKYKKATLELQAFNLKLQEDLAKSQQELGQALIELESVREHSNGYYERYLSFQRLYNDLKSDYNALKEFNSKQKFELERRMAAGKAREMRLQRELDSCCG